MGHTYSQLLAHIIFSTENRIPYLRPDIREHVFRYMAGVGRGVGAAEVLVNGVADHAHIFLKLPPAIPIAEAVQKIKSNSSKWVHDERLLPRAFSWQTGYAAFSVCPSKAAEVTRYIENQDLHHKKVSFQEEYLEFLKKHGIDYDSRYVWG